MTPLLIRVLQSNLSGFYDPCPEEEKMLRIRYLFREALHEVTVSDTEPVRIPKQCKLYFFVLFCMTLFTVNVLEEMVFACSYSV